MCVYATTSDGTVNEEVTNIVHAMYSDEKISSGTDDESALKWETYGIEVGAVCKDSTFTYTNDNFSSDYYNVNYYTIIAHFADGTVLMTEPTD